MKRKVSALFLAVVVALMMIGSVFAADAVGPETWQVTVGKETASASLDSMFPKVVYIHEGDSVVFTNGSLFTPHTVTFLTGQAPLSPQDPNSEKPTAASGISWDGKTLLNSGILVPTTKYEITFTASGAYSYYCVLHPMMTGTVVVVPKGQPIPSKIEQAAAVKVQENDILLQANTLLGSQEAKYTVNSDKSLTYQVGMGSAHTTLSHNRMVPESVVVSAGDTVTWNNLSPYEPHFVTFNKPKDLSFLTEHGFNPKFMAPAGGNVFNGTGFTNSGMVMSGQSYSLQFTKAGTYTYECYLHSGSLMKGTIVVVAKNAVKLIVNGKAVSDSAGAKWTDGVLRVSVAPFTKALGAKSSVDSKTKNATITLSSGQKAVVKSANGFVPAEAVVRALGGSYSWNENTKTFTVTTVASASTPAAASSEHAGH
jgi:plastocyanin